jgi:hypothetical protein
MRVELDRATGQLAQMNSVLSAKGIKTSDELRTHLDYIGKINSNPHVKSIVDEVMRFGPPPATATVPTDPNAPLTMGQLQAVMAEQIKGAFTAHTRSQQEAAYTAALQTEVALSAKVLDDSRLKPLLKGKDYAAALRGEAGEAGRLAAVLTDHLMYERGKTANGSYYPVTKESVAAEVAGEVYKLLGSLRAQTILDASAEPGPGERGGTPDLPLGGGGIGGSVINTIDGFPVFGTRNADTAKVDGEAMSTFQRVFKAVQAANAPASQAF